MPYYGWGFVPGYGPGLSSGAAVVAPSGAPPVQSGTSGGSGGSTTNNQAFTTHVTPGNLLVLLIFNATDLTTTISGITWNGGNSGTLTPTPLSPINGVTRCMWCYTAQITGASGTGVTVTFSAAINSIVIFAEYQGLATSSVIDGEVAANGVSTALNSGNLTTTNANDLLVGGLFVTSSGGGTLSPGAGFTLEVNNASTSHRGLEDRNVTATGPYAATASYSSSQTWIAYLLALKRTTSSGGRAPTQFYVSNAGSDANSGLDAAHSWAHAPGMNTATGIPAAIGLIPGDAILLNRGDSWLNTTLTVHIGGDATGQIILSAYGSGAKPIISAAANNPAITVTSAGMGYWTIDSLDLRSTGTISGINTLATIYHNYWASDLLPVPNWIIQNCVSNAAFYLSGPNTLVHANTLDGGSTVPLGGIIMRGQANTGGSIIELNTVTHFLDRGIWVLNGANGVWSRYNTVHDILAGSDDGGMGINMDGANIQIPNAQVYGNLIYNCAGIGITHENTLNCIASYNCVHDCAQGGIDAISYGTYQTQSSNLFITYNVIYNTNVGLPLWDTQGVTYIGNTLYNGSGASSQGFGIQSLDTNVTNLNFINNIIAGVWTHPVQVRTSKAVFNIFNYCDVVPNGTEIMYQAGTATSMTLAQVQAAGLMANGITANPLFTSTVTPDLSLQAGSPARQTGVDMGNSYRQALLATTVFPTAINLGTQTPTLWNMGAYL